MYIQHLTAQSARTGLSELKLQIEKLLTAPAAVSLAAETETEEETD